MALHKTKYFLGGKIMRNLKDVRTFRIMDKDIAEFAQKINGSGRYETIPFIPTTANQQIAHGELNALLAQVNNLACESPVYDVLKGHFLDFLESNHQRIEDYKENPGRLFQFFGGKLYGLCCADYRPAEQRAEVLRERIKTVPQLWADGLLPYLENLEPDKLKGVLNGLKQAHRTAEYTMPKIDNAFQGIPESQKRDIPNVFE